LILGFVAIAGKAPGSLFSEYEELTRRVYGRRKIYFDRSSRGRFHLLIFGSEKQDFLALQGPSPYKNIYVGSEDDRHVLLKLSHEGLHLSLDWAGSMSLFYSEVGAEIMISTEHRIAHRWASSHGSIVDLEGVGNLIYFSHPLSSDTIFQGLRRLRVGEALTLDLLEGNLKVVHLDPLVSSGTSKRKDQDSRFLEFHELNNHLVKSALEKFDRVILPLSSGYDSRLVLAGAMSDPHLRRKLVTATYGPPNSIEVRAARNLADIAGVPWFHVEIDSGFLGERYLSEIGLKFGSSLHMHGMYQLFFWDKLSEQLSLADSALTSGFMTGVPAGQHLRKLNPFFSHGRRSLLGAASSFSQSKHWTSRSVEQMTGVKWTDKLAERNLEYYLQILDQRDDVASMQFDIWTRQSRFISYYPDTLTLRAEVVSPHMNLQYPKFLWGLNQEWLNDRKFITEYFRRFHPAFSSTPSNSHQFSKFGGRFQASAILLGRASARLGAENLVPKRFRDTLIEFDKVAAIELREKALRPLHEKRTQHLFGEAGIEFNFEAHSIDLRNARTDAAYQRQTALQSLAIELEMKLSEAIS
jgi:hypothetical protein